MNLTRYPAILLATLMVASGCGGPTAEEVLQNVEATYRDLETYKAEGTVTAVASMDGVEQTVETSFRMLLKKPNLYLISWTMKSTEAPGKSQDWAIWNDGTQAYFYSGSRKAYYKKSDDFSAIASATGVSNGAASTIPSLFFPEFFPEFMRGGVVSSTKNARIDRVEEVEGEECYIITGESAGSKEMTYWISKSGHFIVKYYHSLEVPEWAMPIPEIDDRMIERALGREASGARVAEFKKRMEEVNPLLKNSGLTGSSTETHARRSTPKLRKADFQFSLPKDAVQKESLWDDTPVESPERQPEGK